MKSFISALGISCLLSVFAAEPVAVEVKKADTVAQTTAVAAPVATMKKVEPALVPSTNVIPSTNVAQSTTVTQSTPASK